MGPRNVFLGEAGEVFRANEFLDGLDFLLEALDHIPNALLSGHDAGAELVTDAELERRAFACRIGLPNC